MYKGKRVAVVVPAYNVELQIIAVIQGIPEYVDNIIVEDAATDATPRFVQWGIAGHSYRNPGIAAVGRVPEVPPKKA